jgi:hypothetical protein
MKNNAFCSTRNTGIPYKQGMKIIHTRLAWFLYLIKFDLLSSFQHVLVQHSRRKPWPQYKSQITHPNEVEHRA